MAKEKQLFEKKIENLIFIKQQDPAIRTKVNNERYIDLTHLIDITELHDFISDSNKDTISVKVGENKDLNTMFSRLILQVQNQIKDNEINPLYIAFDFICAKDKDSDALIKAPMHFLPVRIRFIKKNIIIEKFQSQKIVNDKLFFFLKQKKLINDHETFIDELMKYNRIESPLEEIECDYHFKRCDGFILGIYELCDTFFYDVTKSIASKTPDLFKTKTKFTKNKISLMELDDKNIIQVTPNPLNIYQRRALISALHQDTIIYGPPGTGKSETITNFIATILNQNKTAIVASEKNAALQVIKERLGELSDFCFFADTTLTKKDFYNRIKKIGELISFSERAKWTIKKPSFFENDNSKRKLFDNIETNINFYKSSDSNNLNIITYFDLIKKYTNHSYLKTSLENMKDKALLKIVELAKLINRLELNSDFTFKQLLEIMADIKKDLKLANFNFKDKIAVGNALNNAMKLDALLTDNQREYARNHWDTIYDELVSANFLMNEFEPYCKDFKNIFNNVTIMDNFAKGFQQNGKKEDKFILDFLKINGFNLKELEIEKTFGLNTKGLKIKVGLIAASSNPLVRSKKISELMTHIDLFKPLNVFLFKHPYFQDQSIQECLDINIDNFIDDKKVLDYILDHKITKDELQTLINLINFEKQVILKAKTNDIPWNENILYDKYYAALKQSQNSIVDIIKNKLVENLQYKISKIKNAELTSQIEQVFQLSNLDKKVDIDKFISTYKDALLELFDVWLGRPEQLTHYLYPSKKTFDYAIFDEASQMYMERSLTIINKAKVRIVAGDDKQLKPANWFESRYTTTEFDLDADAAESLLERVKVAMWPEFTLKYHYRSRSYELIKFSNDEFYHQELEYASWNNENHEAIEIYDITGYVDDGKNENEAQKVLEILQAQHKQHQKVIVITFGIKQADLITNYILKSINSDLKERMLNNTIIVTNLENVQGNEADLVIISNTYGKHKDKKTLSNHFGGLIQNGGKNRLNVALTRAKHKMIIVKSFKANEMAWNRDNENAVAYFHWIKYLDEYKAQKRAPIVTQTNKWKTIETYLSTKLGVNYVVEAGYVVGSKVFDLFITNTKNEKNIGIEIVGLDYFASKLSLIEDFETHLFLKNRNYQCLFVSEFDWYTNTIRIVNEIKMKIDNKNNLLKLAATQHV